MRKPTWTVLIASALLFVGTGSFLARAEAPKSVAGGGATPWKIVGDLEESCSCDGACPGWFGNKPTKMSCSGNAVFFITKGNYGKISLDGLAVGQVLQSPDGKSMMESMGSFNFSNIYLDEKANPEQRKALEAIAAQVLPPVAAPEKTKIQYTSITRTIVGKEHTVTVGSYATFSGHLMETAYGGAPKITNPLLPDPMRKQYLQGVTTRQTYKDAAEWDFSNSNYMFNQFTVTNKDYEELATTMQKMQQMGGMPGMEKK
jgi:hypothetical protein